MSTQTITNTPETEQLRKDLKALAARNERQFQIIEYLLGELKNLGRDIDVLTLNPQEAAKSCSGRNHRLEAELEMKNRELQDELNHLKDLEDKICFMGADLDKCKAEIRRMYSDAAHEQAERFFSTLNYGDEGGAE